MSPADDSAKRKSSIRRVWTEATADDRTRIVEYLSSRGLPEDVLDDVSGKVVRFHPSLDYWDYDADGTPVNLGAYPAMVAMVTNAGGKTVSLHRTYLSADGPGKAPFDDPRKLMTPVSDGATRGAAIRLFEAGSLLGLAEGIETALAVRVATAQRMWAAVSAGGLETVVLPDEVQTVHLWADNDPISRAGQKAAAIAAERFYREGRTVYVHVPPGKKKADWLDVYVKDGPEPLLEELVDREPWKPGDGIDGTQTDAVGVFLSEVEPEQVLWLWDRRLPLGKLTVLDGDPGLGKSTVAFDLAARLTRGRAMPDGTGGGKAAGVVVLSAEDGLTDTIVPRLIAAGADRSRVLALQACPDSDGKGEHPPALPDDIEYVRAAIVRAEARLVIIDPLMAYLSGDTNSHRDQDIRRVLFQVATMAEDTGAAVIAVRHLNKSGGGQAIYRGGGSIGIIGAARSGLLVACDPDDENRRVLAPIKNNLCKPPESLSFHLEADPAGAARVVWDGTSTHSASALLAMPSTDEERHAIDDAKDFLLTVLADGPVASSQVLAEARGAGMSEKTLRRAKDALGVVPKKTSMSGGWVWSLSEDGHEVPKMDTPRAWAPSGDVGHLRENGPGPEATETDPADPYEVLL